jgi:hypothetical protein
MYLFRKTTSAARGRFAPRLEALEDRCVPAISVFQTGATLNVFGDATSAHTVQLTDNGHGGIAVKADNLGTTSFTGINNIDVRGGNLNDTVIYLMTGPLQQAENVTVRLRPGNDAFVGLLQKDFLSGGNLNLRVDGGPGNDHISLTMLGNLKAGSGLTFTTQGGPGKDTMNATMLGAVELGANLSVTMNPGLNGATETVSLLGNKTLAGVVSIDLEGGTGNDLEIVNIFDNIDVSGFVSVIERGKPGNDMESESFLGQDLGILQLQADGGPGDDVISENVTLAPGSNGVVLASEQGGPGNDNLTLTVRKQQASDNPVVSATIDGGPGNNSCTRTSNVTETNCAVDHVVV